MSPDELGYYRHRATIERELAARASNPRAAAIHEEMACLYEKLVELEDEHRPVLHVVAP